MPLFLIGHQFRPGQQVLLDRHNPLALPRYFNHSVSIGEGAIHRDESSSWKYTGDVRFAFMESDNEGISYAVVSGLHRNSLLTGRGQTACSSNNPQPCRNAGGRESSHWLNLQATFAIKLRKNQSSPLPFDA